MPHADELPGHLALLARRNAVELSDKRFRVDVQFLVETLEKIADQKAGSSLTAPAQVPASETVSAVQITAKMAADERPATQPKLAARWFRPWRRTVAVVAVIALAMMVAVGSRALLAQPGLASYTFAPVQDGPDVSALRVWTLSTDGKTVSGSLDFSNSGSSVRTVTHVEVIPKSLAKSITAIKFSLPAPDVLLADPVVRYQLTIPAGRTSHASYTIGVPAAGSSIARVEKWVTDQLAANLAFVATASLPSPSPSQAVSTPTSKPTALATRKPPAASPKTPPNPTPNHAPVANHDYYTGSYALNCAHQWWELRVLVTVLGPDTDADHDPLTVTGVSAYLPINGYKGYGSVAVVGNDVWYYPPNWGFHGTDYGYFTYYIKDGKGGTAWANDEIELVC
jgi:hypothetical protein